MKVRPVVIGAGEMGRRYLRSLMAVCQDYGFEPADMCAVEPHVETRAKVHREFPRIGVHATLEAAMLQHWWPNCAIITTPASVHRQSLAECMRFGFGRVLIEKPLVEDVKHLDEIAIPYLCTAYLVNFSKIVATLREWIRAENVFPAEIASLWCQDWYLHRNHWIEAASDGKVVHPLVLGLMLVDTASPVERFSDVLRSSSRIPHMRPEIRADARVRRYVDDVAVTNSTATIALRAITTSGRECSFHIIGSFNVPRNERFVSIVFVRDGREPAFKATLDFDREYGDRLVIKHAGPPERIVLEETWKGDKIGEQLKAFLDVVSGRGNDPRLTNFQRASHAVALLDPVPKFRVYE